MAQYTLANDKAQKMKNDLWVGCSAENSGDRADAVRPSALARCMGHGFRIASEPGVANPSAAAGRPH